MKKSAPYSTPISLMNEVQYADDSVVSKTLLNKADGNLTLFSFDSGQGLSEHTSPYDAVVQIVDGEAQLTIGGQAVTASAGELVIMPAHVPHSLHAEQPFKMLLIMIRSKVEQEADQ